MNPCRFFLVLTVSIVTPLALAWSQTSCVGTPKTQTQLLTEWQTCAAQGQQPGCLTPARIQDIICAVPSLAVNLPLPNTINVTPPSSWSSPPSTVYDGLRIVLNNFPQSAENLSSTVFVPQSIVGGIDIPSGATSTGGSAFAVSGYCRQNSSGSSPLGCVGVYGQGSTTVSNAAGNVWGANFLASNAPHSDGDASGFTLAGLWGIEVNNNVKSTSSGSAIWPSGLQTFGVQVVGNSSVQPGDGGGTGLAYAFHVRPLGINTNPQKQWDGGLVTADASAKTGVFLGAAAVSGASVNSQRFGFNWYDGSSTSQQFYIGANTVAAGSLLFTGTNANPNFMFQVKTGQDFFLQNSGTGVSITAVNDTNSSNLPMTIAGSTALLQATTGTATVQAGSGQSVVLSGTNVQWAAPTGTPVASLCLDTLNNIIKKTSSGSCI